MGSEDRYFSRDMAILIIGLFGMMRSAEIVSLQHSNVITQSDGSLLVSFQRCKQRLGSLRSVVAIPNRFMGGINPASWVAGLMTTVNQGPVPGKIFDLTPNAISSVLSKWMHRIGEGSDWTSHSIRIGGAVLACEQGKSELEIRGLGGWRSDAIFQYTRDVVRRF